MRNARECLQRALVARGTRVGNNAVMLHSCHRVGQWPE